MKSCDEFGCGWCGDEEATLTKYYGIWTCQSCIEFDNNVDLDEYEQKKRERIAEQNEY